MFAALTFSADHHKNRTIYRTFEEAQKVVEASAYAGPSAEFILHDGDNKGETRVSLKDAPEDADTGMVLDLDAIIADEGMDSDAVGPVASLVVGDDGRLCDDWNGEPADLRSPAAFRDQIRRWKAAVNA